jgi:hypothetical protein
MTRFCKPVHPLPNPSPVEGEGLKALTSPLVGEVAARSAAGEGA